MSSTQKLMLKNVRLIHGALAEPSSMGESEPKYYAKLQITDKALIKEVQDRVTEITKTELKGAKLKYDVVVESDTDKYPKQAGSVTINASNKFIPLFLDADKNDLGYAASGIYAGCYVNVVVSFYPWQNKFGSGITLNLLIMKFEADGAPLGGKATTQTYDDLV